MAELLIFSERDDLAFELVSKGKEFSSALNMKLSAALLGEKIEGKADEYFAYGADRVYVAENPALANVNAESFAEALFQIGQQNDVKILLLPSTKRGKELGPRVAQKLGAGCITDATGVELKDGNLTVSRYSWGEMLWPRKGSRRLSKWSLSCQRLLSWGQKGPNRERLLKSP